VVVVIYSVVQNTLKPGELEKRKPKTFGHQGLDSREVNAFIQYEIVQKNNIFISAKN
jgi:hypothetical protein